MLEARATDGIEKMTISEVTRVAQTNNGIRANVMPGARCFRIVATRLTAAASAAISVKVTICAQMSARLPMPYCGPDKGG
jgi:predicted hotdog family 3-hydroxylacyl-ACP dehydratase